ncbi:hypothetical protein [Tenacibaculum aquimarinum]|uniref:hypothetical protein n=1 Tax=Tenacibaculum aquimarinum TaxID=2910675 RepID=UPI001F0AAD42|nr:hypothetical protein [Tenacibaculum aquimarinum]MCH3884622.1 hypothetical protein [Tenacibaculum aquimarinum]
MKKINVIKLLKLKENNIKYCLKILKNSNIRKVLFNLGKNKGMGLLLKFEETEHQNYVRDKLIKSKIFPAVLWPEQTLKRDIEVQNTMLFIHTDFRYNKQDLDVILKKLIVYIKEWKSLKY